MAARAKPNRPKQRFPVLALRSGLSPPCLFLGWRTGAVTPACGHVAARFHKTIKTLILYERNRLAPTPTSPYFGVIFNPPPASDRPHA